MAGTPTTPRPAGGPVLQDSVTAAITEAFFVELAATGYARLSLEAVAKRAGAGKAAIYRRWSSKQDMTLALLSELVTATPEPVDTGTLRGDLAAFLAEMAEGLGHPLVLRILPDLIAEGGRNHELGEALLSTVRDPRRARATRMLDRAVDRGELPAGLDLTAALDLLAGPLYWHLAVVRAPATPEYLDRLTAMLHAALRA
ncbi:TetR-like C-terminal domain-containing protein [Kitasatospora sp. NPDC004289]